MAEIEFNADKYAELLARIRPTVIGSDEEHDRLLTVAEELMDRGPSLTAEEHKLLELLVVLIRVFEEQVEAAEDEDDDNGRAEPPAPHETLQRLMQSRGWDAAMLSDVFGNPMRVSEVLAGKREISKGQAKELAKLFKTPFKLFLER